jgi:hypothetical protein
MSTFDDFKQCLKIQGNLDLEALDVMFVEPLKDLYNWWQNQSNATKAYINWFTAGLGGSALVAFIAKVVGSTAQALATSFAEALGAVIVGMVLGVFIDILGRCSLLEVTAS